MNAKRPLDDTYFEWLCRQVSTPIRGAQTESYLTLLTQLHNTPFVFSIPNDDNRAEDGVGLRTKFVQKNPISFIDHFWFGQDCSLLEMLVALAERTAFESYDQLDRWFHLFLKQLMLDEYTDYYYRVNRHAQEEVEHILHVLNHREYESNGTGGLFPLHNPSRDQREVELWYQMSSYLLEGG